jgi:hypothetical protein
MLIKFDFIQNYKIIIIKKVKEYTLKQKVSKYVNHSNQNTKFII